MKSGRRKSKQRKLPAFAEELISMAEDVLSHESPSPQEKETLQFWMDQLVSSVDDLMDIFAAHDALLMGLSLGSPAVVLPEFFHSGAEMLLNGALSAAFMISSHAGENPIKARLDREAKKENTAPATLMKIANSNRINDVIISVGEPVWTKFQTLTANGIANKIVDAVNEKLKSQNLKTMKPDTIARRVKRLRTNVRPSR
jgi:hypothetical protein